MKKLLLSIFLLLVLVSPTYALIVTDNVDRDNFDYEVAFGYATQNVGAALITGEVCVETDVATNFYYVVPRDGRVVGMSVAGNTACTAGAATFDITINGQVTGIQTIIEPLGSASARSAVGIDGSAGTTYAYIRQDRASTTVAQGFRDGNLFGADRHNAEHPYGKATALSAGNRIGVKLTTSSGFTPDQSTDYVVVIYVLE